LHVLGVVLRREDTMVNKIDKVLTSVQFNGEGKIKSLKETILNSEWFCSYEECDRR
jgi:hypothetical protein